MSRESVLLAGLAKDETLARLLGREDSESKPPGFRFGNGPKDNRLTPEVDNRGTCLPVALDKLDFKFCVGVVSSAPASDEAVDPTLRFLERIVTVDGTETPPMTEDRGEARGGVLTGAGSFDLADCTRASRRCIWAVRDRIWEREFEGGSLWEVARVVLVGSGFAAGVRVALLVVATRVPGARALDDAVEAENLGLGVILWSADGSRDFLCVAGPGVLIGAPLAFGSGAEASDMGGDGGSWISETVSAVERDLVSGGVVISGELAVEFGERSNVGDSGTDMSVEIADKCRNSCFLILSWRISASIFRSDNSSRNRCASTRSASRSCSPT